VNLPKVIVHEIDTQGVDMVLNLLGMGIRKARKPPHPHPHRQVGAFRIAR
jgi:hypothetical protein